MKSRTISAALASAAVLFLLSSSAAVFADPPQTLSLDMPAGGVTNLGVQTYNVAGGQVVYAAVNGAPLDPGANLQYSYTATQNAFSTSGQGSMTLTGTSGGSPVSVTGTFTFDSISALAVIGNSELPGFFVSSAPSITINDGGIVQTLAQPLVAESPYINPFGAPIVLSSMDGVTLIVVARFSTGTINWQGTSIQGAVTGQSGPSREGLVTGTVILTGNEAEDLVAGTATDQGSITFTGMSQRGLNAVGTYTGSDIIPTTGAIDCSAYTGVTGTCTETGFTSTGTFSAGQIKGGYSTQWSVPALGFYSTINATTAN
ncbi:MAG TPA: hypothetical protein VJR06_02400 [Nitrososphaerales archaeon]|nr:hypothetical protein [Nitrososphaerales archaeon]